MIQGLFRKSALFLALAGLTFAAQAYTFKPAAYEVTTRGNAGPLTVVTTFSKNRIEKIEIKTSNDTSYVGGVAMEKVRNEILSKQHLGVDTVSGATMSSAALLRAVGEAAEKAGVSAESLVPHKKPVNPAALPAEKITTDVVVIGAGGTGLAAAATAAEKGAKVLLIEKMPFAGGSSALAGGAIVGTGTSYQKAAGIRDDVDDMLEDWAEHDESAVKGGDKDYPDPKLRRLMLERSTEAVEWLGKTVGLEFAEPRPFGHGGDKRAHAPKASPVPASGMGSSPAGGAFVVKAVEDYAKKLGVAMRFNTTAYELVKNEKGEVTGVLAHDGKKRYEIAADAVVLATGGFAHNMEMMAERLPVFTVATERSVAAKGDTGDGLRMALKAGAAEADDSWVIGLHLLPRYDELKTAITGKSKQRDLVLVNEKGERFVNEALPYVADHCGMQRVCWVIIDSSDVKKADIAAKYFNYDVAVYGEDFTKLGRRMGVPAEVFAKTMADYNENAEDGDDPVFGKDEDYLRPLVKAPFFAIRVEPGLGGTIGGVKTTSDFEVLDKAGKVIPGLYAGGEMANRPYYARNYESGTGLGLAYGSGRTAGAKAAERAKAR